MKPELLTALTSEVQEFVHRILMGKTDVSRIDCFTVALNTAAAFQTSVKQRTEITE
jgi:hypothetical protein